MKWVKASERLPEQFKVVVCKYTPDSPDPRRDTELHWGFVNKKNEWVGNYWKSRQVEWLDESESTPSGKGAEEAKSPGDLIALAYTRIPDNLHAQVVYLMQQYAKLKCAEQKISIDVPEEVERLNGELAKHWLAMAQQESRIKELEEAIVLIQKILSCVPIGPPYNNHYTGDFHKLVEKMWDLPLWKTNKHLTYPGYENQSPIKKESNV